MILEHDRLDQYDPDPEPNVMVAVKLSPWRSLIAPSKGQKGLPGSGLSREKQTGTGHP